MASARMVLAFLGIIFAVAGLAVAWTFDPLIGIGVLVVGAFLLILPITRDRGEE